jgi:hypothetical protein
MCFNLYGSLALVATVDGLDIARPVPMLIVIAISVVMTFVLVISLPVRNFPRDKGRHDPPGCV